ncbi:MAG: hypothetical protein HYY30_09780 [Chloroflexi bacterium]|nr:hypothetical protein [Chloroflexota bacterium]
MKEIDALVYPFARLIEVLRHIGEKLPDGERIGAYATPQDVLRRDVEELRPLRELKLGIIYMGVESGDDEVLEKGGKDVHRAQIVAAGRKV